MFRNVNLQTRLIGAFLIMGLIVLVVGVVGWSGTYRLSKHIDTLSDNSLPSVDALWQINEGQTQIQSSERLLLDPRMTQSERQAALTQISKAWKEIDEGFKQYEGIPRISEEDRRYQKFLQDWNAWKQSHEKLLEAEQAFSQTGIRNPWEKQVQLLSQAKGDSPEMGAVNQALALRNQLDRQKSQELSLFNKAADSVLGVIAINEEVAVAAKRSADRDINQTSFWAVVGMVIGPLTAIILGGVLSTAIAKPLDRAINGIINIIASSATEIAATVEQHERIATQQATSVNQTTTTMHELGASSQQAADQAELAATTARQMGQQILRLNEQTRQIGTISNLVSDLAGQTNMLALNAAVEAVRAGENGRGFAVVAAEIRKLADESKKSAAKINTFVVDIQNITDSNVMLGNEGMKVESIVSAVNNIAISSQQISFTAKQQAIAIQQVVMAMNAINVGAQDTASGITQTKVGIQKLNEAARNLRALGVG